MSQRQNSSSESCGSEADEKRSSHQRKREGFDLTNLLIGPERFDFVYIECFDFDFDFCSTTYDFQGQHQVESKMA